MTSTNEQIALPKMRTINQACSDVGLSYRCLMTLCKQNKIVHIKVGSKYMINLDKLIEFLNQGEIA